MQQILSQYNNILKNTIVDQREKSEKKLNDWLSNTKERMVKGDFENKSVGEKYKILKESLYKFLEDESK